MSHILLAIETSCDDTAAAVLSEGRLLAQVVSSQQDHARWGGVVPELASRTHMRSIVPVVLQALQQADTTLADLGAVACTAGPGLMGALLVGHTFARALAQARGLDFVEVHHMLGHVHSLFLAVEQPSFPLLCLTVSGGHTQITRVDDYLALQVLGQTRDDAAGEAFDKAAKLLGFPYPGGPALDRASEGGDPHFLPLPPPQVEGLDFSFSGLKTALLYRLQAELARDPDYIARHRADICASVQHRIVHALLEKLFAAAEQTGIQTLGIVGGVSANRALRAEFLAGCVQRGYQGFIPEMAYCMDNAAMIAMAGWHRWRQGRISPLTAVPFATGSPETV